MALVRHVVQEQGDLVMEWGDLSPGSSGAETKSLEIFHHDKIGALSDCFEWSCYKMLSFGDKMSFGNKSNHILFARVAANCLAS